MRKKWRCVLGVHRWRELRAEGGGSYRECRDCGKFRDVDERPKLV